MSEKHSAPSQSKAMKDHATIRQIDYLIGLGVNPEVANAYSFAAAKRKLNELIKAKERERLDPFLQKMIEEYYEQQYKAYFSLDEYLGKKQYAYSRK